MIKKDDILLCIMAFFLFIGGGMLIPTIFWGLLQFITWDTHPYPWWLFRLFSVLGLGVWVAFVVDVIRGKI